MVYHSVFVYSFGQCLGILKFSKNVISLIQSSNVDMIFRPNRVIGMSAIWVVLRKFRAKILLQRCKGEYVINSFFKTTITIYRMKKKTKKNFVKVFCFLVW